MEPTVALTRENALVSLFVSSLHDDSAEWRAMLSQLASDGLVVDGTSDLTPVGQEVVSGILKAWDEERGAREGSRAPAVPPGPGGRLLRVGLR